MWFLELDEAGEVRHTKDFSSDEVPRRYAILSHTWGKDGEEVTFRDVEEQTGIDKPGRRKIQFCAQQAERDGIKFFWIDTCCIDKTNSVELAKAITSMFRWYSEAEKCYVYLSDVPRQSSERGKEAADLEADFRHSKWFTRGWTLQEMIAPASVEFFSRHGDRLGDKSSLETQICSITRIPVEALRGSLLSTFTKHERFQWQDGRQTREEEDMVYSLFGIFDVSMPVIYGEGMHKARRRLESEIDRAWKGTHHESFAISFCLTDAVATANFVARSTDLHEMLEELRSDGTRRTVTLYGLGGIGKTQLAIAYATRHKDSYSAIFWINSKDEESLKLSFAKIARQIVREHPTANGLSNVDTQQDLNDVVESVKSWLSLPGNARWLLIYDNYDNPRLPGHTDPSAVDLRKFLPDSYQGSIIVTTRSSQVDMGHSMRIVKLDQLEDSLSILSHASRRGGLSEDAGAVELAKQLDGFPLALATAGAYLRQASISFAQYSRLYETPWAKLQKSAPALISYEDRTLYSTWQLSFDRIQQENKISANLLRLWAYFDNQDIWFELLRHSDDESPPWFRKLTEDEIEFHSIVRVLCDHGIVEANATTGEIVESGGYSMHSCVHAWTKTVLNAEWNEELARLSLWCVASHVPNTLSNESWQIQRRLINHAPKAIRVSRENIGAEDTMVLAYDALAIIYHSQDMLHEAEMMYKRILPGHETVRWKITASVLARVVNLATIYTELDKLIEAENLVQEALQGYETTFGKDHELTLRAVSCIADLYLIQGKLDESEEAHQRALQGLETTLPKDHVSTIDAVNSLGFFYLSQGRLDKAEEMFQRALRAKTKSLEKDHTSTLSTVLGLGSVYRDQGRFEEAEKVLRRAVQGFEVTVGKDDVYTLDAVRSLGILYAKQGRLDEAETMCQRAIQGLERAGGKNHILTLDVVDALGTIFTLQGRLDDAEVMLQRALQGYKMALGEDHASTLRVRRKLGGIYKRQGRLDEAEKIYRPA